MEGCYKMERDERKVNISKEPWIGLYIDSDYKSYSWHVYKDKEIIHTGFGIGSGYEDGIEKDWDIIYRNLDNAFDNDVSWASDFHGSAINNQSYILPHYFLFNE